MSADRVDIGNAIIAGIGAADTPLEQMVEIMNALDRAGFMIVPCELRSVMFRAIARKRFGPPSHWEIKGRPEGWHLDRDCTPEEACMHDNGVNDALRAFADFPGRR